MIYDCFTFFNEHELFELRLKHLWDYVDKFVVVEGSRTHSGMAKPYYLDEIDLSKYEDKLIRVRAKLPESDDRWYLENMQRDAIKYGLEECVYNDIIMVSDCDEFPSQAAFDKINDIEVISVLSQKACLWYVDWYDPSIQWAGTVVTTYKEFQKHGAQTLRNSRFSLPRVEDGGCHFTWLGDNREHVIKLEAFAHGEYDNDIGKCGLAKYRGQLADPFGRGSFHGVKLDMGDPNFPAILRDNRSKYQKFFLPV